MECSAIPSRVIASCFAITGFVAALVIGFAASLSTDEILLRAIVVMAICWPVGRLLGGMAQRAVEENVSQYKRAHPIPDSAVTDAAAHHDAAFDDSIHHDMHDAAEDARHASRSA
jgi:hypothetical protein